MLFISLTSDPLLLTQVDGTSTMYSMNLSRGGKTSLPPKYEDMYSEAGTNVSQGFFQISLLT